jgi:predicted DsbA family dithiol-disulfide isomerase
MKVEFFFDVICPWCYVGKVRFARALRQRQDYRVDVRFTPFLLNPDLPMGGVDRQTFLERKLGGPSRVQRLNNAVMEASKAEGVRFNFERIYRTPNSIHAHRLIKFATQMGLAIPAIDTLFKSYFRDGVDVGQIEDLIELGGELGLDDLDVARFLYSDLDFSTVMSDNTRAHRMGVTGVPCVVVDEKFAISGAQESDVLVRLLDLAAENQMEQVSTLVS